MTARRYSGDVTIYVTLVEDQERQIPGAPATYKCIVQDRRSGDRGECYVGHPRHLVRAVDSPEAFDEAAHAALSIVQEDPRDGVLTLYPEYTDSGYHVARRR